MAAAALVLTFLAQLTGCACLALTQRPTRRRVMPNGAPAIAPTHLAQIGSLLTLMSAGLCILREGVGFGIVLALLIFAVSAFATAMILAAIGR